MALKMPSAMVDRQIFPKQTKRTEICSDAMMVVLCCEVSVVELERKNISGALGSARF